MMRGRCEIKEKRRKSLPRITLSSGVISFIKNTSKKTSSRNSRDTVPHSLSKEQRKEKGKKKREKKGKRKRCNERREINLKGKKKKKIFFAHEKKR